MYAELLEHFCVRPAHRCHLSYVNMYKRLKEAFFLNNCIPVHCQTFDFAIFCLTVLWRSQLTGLAAHSWHRHGSCIESHNTKNLSRSLLGWIMATVKRIPASGAMKSNAFGGEKLLLLRVLVLCVSWCRSITPHLGQVTCWIVSMMCQVAGHTLSNLIRNNNFKQHSCWNIISLRGCLQKTAFPCYVFPQINPTTINCKWPTLYQTHQLKIDIETSWGGRRNCLKC